MTDDTLAERDPSVICRGVTMHERTKPMLPEFFDGHGEEQTGAFVADQGAIGRQFQRADPGRRLGGHRP